MGTAPRCSGGSREAAGGAAGAGEGGVSRPDPDEEAHDHRVGRALDWGLLLIALATLAIFAAAVFT